MKNTTSFKPFDKLVCSDNFMFSKIMEDAELCKKVLEVLLNIEIGELSYPEAEKTIQSTPGARAIRLDVHTCDGMHEFDIEIQTTLYKDLRKRSRYYQSLMDVDYLLKGHRYSRLKENIVIFICLKDLFKKNLPVYTFENICRENNSIKLEDKTLKVFYNCSRWNKAETEGQRLLLKFLFTNSAENDLCRKLEEKEKKIKMTARAQKEYMDYCILRDSLERKGYKQGREHGKEEGRTEAKLADARNMLAENIPEDVIVRCTGLPLETVQQLAKELAE